MPITLPTVNMAEVMNPSTNDAISDALSISDKLKQGRMAIEQLNSLLLDGKIIHQTKMIIYFAIFESI